MVAWFLGAWWQEAGRETFAGILQKRRHFSLRARDFESELSVQDMLNMHRKRNADRDPQTEGQPEATAVLTPEVLAAKPSWLQLKPAAELPCVFTPREEGVRKLGEPIELKFWQHAYVRLWQHARLHTGGAVAVRYSRGSLARSPHAFALWPSAPRERPDLSEGIEGIGSVWCLHTSPKAVCKGWFWVCSTSPQEAEWRQSYHCLPLLIAAQ